MRTIDEIHELYCQREKQAGTMMSQFRMVTDIYNAEVVVPLGFLGKTDRPAIANHFRTGIDAAGQRIGSQLPLIDCDPIRPGIKADHTKARNRKMALSGWWEHSRLDMKLRRRGRWMYAYSSAPAVVRPCFKTGVPKWHNRNPLAAYPAPMSDPDDLVPDDIIFAFTHSRAWLAAYYPETFVNSPLHKGKPDDRLTVLEYIDREQITMLVAGKINREYMGPALTPSDPGDVTHVALLESVPNRAEVPLATYPGAISLDKRSSKYVGAIGQYFGLAELDAYSRAALKKGVLQEEWLVADGSGDEPTIVQASDPFKGQPGIVKGGQLVNRSVDPQFATRIGLADYEQNLRMNLGVPAELDGMAASNIRTGRRASQLLAASVDPSIQEAQSIIAHALVEENKIAVAIAKAYFGNDRKSFYVERKGSRGQADYVPNVDFDTDQNRVSYAWAGADTNGLVIEAGQRVGMGTMSARTFAELDPMIVDAEAEMDRVTAERFHRAFLAQVEQRATMPPEQGGYSPLQLAKLEKLILQDKKELYEAIEQIDREAREAQMNAEPSPEEMMPGLEGPDQPLGPSDLAAIQAPNEAQDNMGALLMRLRQPAMRTDVER